MVGKLSVQQEFMELKLSTYGGFLKLKLMERNEKIKRRFLDRRLAAFQLYFSVFASARFLALAFPPFRPASARFLDVN